MARIGIVFGLLLCGLTLLALVGMPVKSPTQFVPMMLGIPILFCGVVALNPHRRKHAMHVASGVAVLGAVAGGVWVVYCLIELGGGGEVHLDALNLVLAMTAVSTAFVVICVLSFIRARRRKGGDDAVTVRATINLHQPTDPDDSRPEVDSRESA